MNVKYDSIPAIEFKENSGTSPKLKTLRIPIPTLGTAIGFRDRLVWSHREKCLSLFDTVPTIAQTCEYARLERHAVARAVGSLTEKSLLDATGKPVILAEVFAPRELAKGEPDTPFNKIRFFQFHPSANPAAFQHEYAALYCRLLNWQSGVYSFKKLGDQVGIHRTSVKKYMDVLAEMKLAKINRFFERGDFTVEVAPIKDHLKLFAYEKEKLTETKEENSMISSFTNHLKKYSIPEGMARSIAERGIAKNLNAVEFSNFVDAAHEENKTNAGYPHCGKLLLYRFNNWPDYQHLTEGSEHVFPTRMTAGDLSESPKHTIKPQPRPLNATSPDPEPEMSFQIGTTAAPTAYQYDPNDDPGMTTPSLIQALTKKFGLRQHDPELEKFMRQFEGGILNEVLGKVYVETKKLGNCEGNLIELIEHWGAVMGAVVPEYA